MALRSLWSHNVGLGAAAPHGYGIDQYEQAKFAVERVSLKISRPDEAESPVTCFNAQDTVTLRMIDDVERVLTVQTSFGNGGYSSPLADR